MSKAFQCDRCGEMYSGKPQTKITQTSGGTRYTMFESNGEVQADMCKGCSKKFRNFME